MHILEFPPELLHRILYFSALCRGVTRALRLKLVCRAFYQALEPALFETRLLDEFPKDIDEPALRRPFPLEHWQARKLYGCESLWHAYTVYRASNETDANVGRYVEIRQVANELCRRTGASYELTIDALCWLVIDRASWRPVDRREWGCGEWRNGEWVEFDPDPDLNLLCAATYLNHIGLARRLLQEGHCPTTDNGLFPSPIYLAARTCNFDMVKLFREECPDMDETASTQPWRSSGAIRGITGAVESGNLDMVRLLVEPLLRPEAGEPQDGTGGLRIGLFCIAEAVEHITSWDVYQYIRPFLPYDPNNRRLLGRHTEFGNVEMVRGLLDEKPAHVHGWRRHDGYPLINAAGACHEDLVDLLLERGAHPNQGQDQHIPRASALVAAASAGSLSIVRKLLDCGAHVGLTAQCAVETEHVQMLELLLERTTLDVHQQSRFIEVAERNGLESIAEFLRLRFRA
ncbi:hypothetical protein AAE478_003320 [Parahypoxylon ruwenzoriense]